VFINLISKAKKKV